MKTGGSRLHLEIPWRKLASPGDSAELLVASAAGSGLFLRLAGRTAGGAASGGLFLRLIGRAAGGTGPAR